ncbi:MAG: hypothetical protein R3214_09670 [Christiangramia sp.]|nr:hypothetical protein [Christiangramia sp.]
MKLYYILRNKLNLLFIPVVLFAMVSCGSYQYSGYEADGIYGESRPGIWKQEEPQPTEVRPNNNNHYYKNLFAQQSEMYGEILESDIFTDVESYTSSDGYENYNDIGGDVAYVGGNAPWGDDPDTYTINIYNNGFYSPWRYGWAYQHFPFYYGGFYDPWYYPYWHGGYWGGPIAYGYGSYWNIGFGFGYPFYSGYYPYYRPYYRHHYSPYSYNNNIAYNQGRRNSTAYYSDGENRRNNSARSSYSRSIREIRNSRSSDYGTSRVRSSASNNDDRTIYTRTNRRTESSRSYDYNRSRNSSPVYQRSSQSTDRTYRSSPSRRSNSSSPTRSSTTRSSSSSSRSSGTTTRSSGGRSSRGGRGGIQ